MVKFPTSTLACWLRLTLTVTPESDSDSDIESYTNRGHKLKKRARFAHKGQLVPAVGPGAYREVCIRHRR